MASMADPSGRQCQSSRRSDTGRRGYGTRRNLYQRSSDLRVEDDFEDTDDGLEQSGEEVAGGIGEG